MPAASVAVICCKKSAGVRHFAQASCEFIRISDSNSPPEPWWISAPAMDTITAPRRIGGR